MGRGPKNYEPPLFGGTFPRRNFYLNLKRSFIINQHTDPFNKTLIGGSPAY